MWFQVIGQLHYLRSRDFTAKGFSYLFSTCNRYKWWATVEGFGKLLYQYHPQWWSSRTGLWNLNSKPLIDAADSPRTVDWSALRYFPFTVRKITDTFLLRGRMVLAARMTSVVEIYCFHPESGPDEPVCVTVSKMNMVWNILNITYI